MDGENSRLKSRIEEISKNIDQIMKKVAPYMPSGGKDDSSAPAPPDGDNGSVSGDAEVDADNTEDGEPSQP